MNKFTAKEPKWLMNAVWFSRHAPTVGQLQEADDMGFEIQAIESGRKLGLTNILTDSDAEQVICDLLRLMEVHSAKAVFGVWPNDLLAEMQDNAQTAVLHGVWGVTDVLCYGSSNTLRTNEGDKPTFSHRKWKLVGRLAGECRRCGCF